MSEQIGKHKGAVETLLHEKKELSRILSIVNGQLERHLNALEEQGVDTDEFISQLQQSQQRRQQARQKKARERGEQSGQHQEKAQRGSQRESQRSGRQERSRQRQQDDEKDVDDMLESEDRDFNPL